MPQPCQSKINEKQRKFCEEYLIDLNATQAAIRAGYSEKTAKVIGNENLTKPYIQSEIQRLQKTRSKRTEITADRVLKELARIGFANIDDILDFDNESVTIKDSKTLKKKVKSAISEVSKTISKDGISIKVKMYDKISALDKIARHLGMYEEKKNNDTTQEAGHLSELFKAMVSDSRPGDVPPGTDTAG